MSNLVRGLDLRAYRPADNYLALEMDAAGKFDITDPTQWVRIPHKGLTPNVSFVTDDLTEDGSIFEEEGNILQQLEMKLTLIYDTDDAFIKTLLAAEMAGSPMPLIFLYGKITDVGVVGYGGFWSVAIPPQTELKSYVKFDGSFKPRSHLNVRPHQFGNTGTIPSFTAVNSTGGTWEGV